MNNPRLANRYAKSLLQLAAEQNKVESVYSDMLFLREVSKASPDFVNLFRSPIIAPNKKEKVVLSVIGNKVSDLTIGFIKLLVKKSRESFLPEMIDAVIDQYYTLNRIHRIKFTTAAPVSKELEQEIISKVNAHPGFERVEMRTAVDDSLIGGYKFEMGDILIDASIARDLSEVKKQFKSNEYIHRIR